LAAVLIGEAMLAFAAEDMGDDLCDVLSGQFISIKGG
jgi:hypothetical protein